MIVFRQNKCNAFQHLVNDCVTIVMHYIVSIKDNNMGRACGMHGTEEKYMQSLAVKPEGKVWA
jgi:hypothetical protein